MDLSWFHDRSTCARQQRVGLIALTGLSFVSALLVEQFQDNVEEY